MTIQFNAQDIRPADQPPVATPPRRSVRQAMQNGFGRHCPRCGKGALFSGFLKVGRVCPNCGLELHHHRADDLPPYLTIIIVGHVVVGAMLGGWKVWHLTDTVQYALWPALALGLSLALLAPIKGAVVGLQWALGMHGFGQTEDDDQPHT